MRIDRTDAPPARTAAGLSGCVETACLAHRIQYVACAQQIEQRLINNWKSLHDRIAKDPCPWPNQAILVGSGPIRVARLEHEWYDDIVDPLELIARLAEKPAKADLFTFWQRLPDTEPRFDFHMERESLAALPVKTFADLFGVELKPGECRQLRRRVTAAAVAFIGFTGGPEK